MAHIDRRKIINLKHNRFIGNTSIGQGRFSCLDEDEDLTINKALKTDLIKTDLII